MSDMTVMTEESVKEMLERAGADVASRSGRSESYGAPRDFSFEVKAAFGNGMGLQIVARQFNYRDPWEVGGRVNDMVDVSLLRNGSYSPLPKGFPYFQGTDQEEGVDAERLAEIITVIRSFNPKLYLLQELTGDM
ncbi:hypothetical protein OR1_02797 [Geobacter sp. OR-1]|uniref:hypothetical protein n=1 Tax=Geobacter sp. OR-1 TaxID=1266765 RepID=UPI0005432424|nr:hypothetical protein [Geobacter sp. OR-1]GAM10508.1 hypothetical protein OR1_02797 [Geobacter sp. OR-1]